MRDFLEFLLLDLADHLRRSRPKVWDKMNRRVNGHPRLKPDEVANLSFYNVFLKFTGGPESPVVMLKRSAIAACHELDEPTDRLSEAMATLEYDGSIGKPEMLIAYALDDLLTEARETEPDEPVTDEE